MAPRVEVPPFLTRVRGAYRALRDLLRDPNRLDRVLALGEAVNVSAIAGLWARFADDSVGRALLRDKPAIDHASVDFAALRLLPEGTLGREYTRFLDDNGITPDVFQRPNLSNAEVAYLAQRMRQTHDLWHVITGYSPDVPGEILLQVFTYAQTGAPSAFLIGFFGTLRFGLKTDRPQFLKQVVRAYRAGKACRFLPTVHWETLWSAPVESLRRDFHCARMA